MDRALVSVITLLWYFSEGLTENVGINSKLLESYHHRSFLGRSTHKRNEESHHHQHQQSGHGSTVTIIGGPSHDNPLLNYLVNLGVGYIMNALQSSLTKTTRPTTTTTTTKPPSTTTTPPSTTQASWAAHPSYSVSCHDNIPTCLNYGPDICMHYPVWAKQQCAQFCVFCINTASSNYAPIKTKPTTSTATHGNGGAIP